MNVQTLPLIQSLSWLSAFFAVTGAEFPGQDQLGAHRLYLLSSILLTIVCACFLIAFRKKVGVFLFGGGDKQGAENTLNAAHCHAAAISVVGLYHIVTGSAGFVGKVLSGILANSSGKVSIIQTIGSGLPSAVELLFGTVLFLMELCGLGHLFGPERKMNGAAVNNEEQCFKANIWPPNSVK